MPNALSFNPKCLIQPYRDLPPCRGGERSEVAIRMGVEQWKGGVSTPAPGLPLVRGCRRFSGFTTTACPLRVQGGGDISANGFFGFNSTITATASLIVLFLAIVFFFAPVAKADAPPQKADSIQVMESFDRQNLAGKEAISEHKKHLIMFIIGVPLLILVIITGALGIAMVVYGKPVFVMHMICAGLSVTLVVVHAIVGLVWFNPF